MNNLTFLTKDEYLEITKKYEGGHWTSETVDSRWDYHYRTIELIKSLNVRNPNEVLEMGTMGVSCVNGSDTIDYSERWDFPGKKPNYIHDARSLPWPVKDKQYEIFVALRVYQHLTPYQKECTLEAARIAKKVIIIVPAIYINKVLPDSKGITYKDFTGFLGGVHPNLYIPTAHGYLYYWDTENPSKVNLEQVMEHIAVAKSGTEDKKNIVNSYEIPFSDMIKLLFKKIKRKISI